MTTTFSPLPAHTDTDYVRRVDIHDAYTQPEVAPRFPVHVTSRVLFDGVQVFLAEPKHPANGQIAQCWEVSGGGVFATVLRLNVFRRDVTLTPLGDKDGVPCWRVTLFGRNVLIPRDESLPNDGLPDLSVGDGDEFDVISVYMFADTVYIGPKIDVGPSPAN
jgi:hypothetical protein